jgi:hypothetical protein
MDTSQARAFAAGALAAVVLGVTPLTAFVLHERASSSRNEAAALEEEVKAIAVSVSALQQRLPMGPLTIAESVDLRLVDAVVKACQAKAPVADAPGPAAYAPVAQPVARTPEQDEALERAQDLFAAVLRRGEYSADDAMAIRQQLRAANSPEEAHSLRQALVAAFNDKKITTTGRFVIP